MPTVDQRTLLLCLLLASNVTLGASVRTSAGTGPKVTITEDVALAGLTSADPYGQVTKALKEARKTGRMRLYQIGRSSRGRPVQLAALCPVRSQELPPVRIMIICAQHGDEPAGSIAAARLIRHCTFRKPPQQFLGDEEGISISHDALQRVLWLIVPVANPDGMLADNRRSAAGADLNRDWTTRSQPETQAIKRAFDRWRPQMVIDLHQWSPGDPPPAENGLELPIAARQSGRELLQRDLAISALSATGPRLGPVALVTSPPTANPSLAHRYFARRGAVSYLIETAAGASLTQRVALLQSLIIVLSSRAGESESLAQLYPQAPEPPAEFRDWFAATLGEGTLRREAAKDFWNWTALVCCCLLLALVRLQNRQTEQFSAAPVRLRCQDNLLTRRSGLSRRALNPAEPKRRRGGVVSSPQPKPRRGGVVTRPEPTP